MSNTPGSNQGATIGTALSPAVRQARLAARARRRRAAPRLTDCVSPSASCSNYELGYFSAYRYLAEEHPDLVVFLGDYIYEYVSQSPQKVRAHSDGVEATDLRTYRNRYAQYRTAPDLQNVDAAAPCLMTWSDHEVQNDYADR
jgi:alkaline phosphatase D